MVPGPESPTNEDRGMKEPDDGAHRHRGGARRGHRSSARAVHRAPAVQPRGAVRQEAAGRRRPPPLRLPRGRRDVDERRHARAQGPARPDPVQDLPHRLHRRCHPGGPLRGLRHVGEHLGLPAGVQERADPPRPAAAPLCRQRRRLPLASSRPGVRQARRGADPRKTLAAGGEGQDRALLPDASGRLAGPRRSRRAGDPGDPDRRGHRG